MRFFTLIFCVIFSSKLFALSTDQNINKNENNLLKNEKQEKIVHKKLNDIAKKIQEMQMSVKRLDFEISFLQEHIDTLMQESKDARHKLKNLTEDKHKLSKTKKELEQKIMNIIAKEFSFYLITDKNYQDSFESIMADEILYSLNGVLKKNFKNLTNTYEKTSKTIKEHDKKIEDIKNSLKTLTHKQKQLKKKRKERNTQITNLELQKLTYKRKLDRIINQRNELKKTLQKLKILKQSEQEVSYKKGTINEDLSVKQVGSSYLHTAVKRYRGSKTIAPLKNFTIKQEFGNYIDPIYKIKIFNETIVLSSNIPNDKVRNVLSGKVIFAKDTAMSKKVVIIENKNGIHTIYSHLDKIAPTVKVGRWIKKGYIIGKVKNDLTFEVMQKNYHINPLELIQH